MRIVLQTLLISFLFHIIPVFSIQQYHPKIANPILEPWRWKQIVQLNGKGVRCMTEGADGTMWFGVDQGVMGYDGKEWITYPLTDSQNILQVISLCATTNGNLYAGTDKGLYLLSASKWKRIFPQQNIVQFPANSIIELNDGSILVGFGTRTLQSINAGLLHLKDDKFVFYASRHSVNLFANFFNSHTEFYTVADNFTLTNNERKHIFNVLDVFEDYQGIIYAAISGYSKSGIISIFEYDVEKSVKLVSKKVYSEDDGVDIRDYVKIAQSYDNKIWVVSNAHERGINCFDGNSWESFKLSDRFGGNDSQNQVMVSSDSTVWIDGHGKFFTLKNNVWTLYRLPDVPVLTSSRVIFYEASDGSIWIAGKQNEVFRLDYTNDIWATYEQLNFQCETNEGVSWFLTEHGRAVYKNGMNWLSYGTEDGLMDTPVRLLVTSYGEIWAAGSHHGFAATAYFDGQKWNIQHHRKLSWGIDYRAVFEAKNGSLYFGCGVDFQTSKGHIGGVLRLKNPAEDKNSWIHYSANNGAPIGMAYGIGQSRDGVLWVGGRIVWAFDGDTWQIRDDLVSLREYVDVVHSSPTNELWLGFRNYGLFRFDGQTWQQYTVDDGLVSNSIISICAESDSSVWVATEKDICRFDGRTFTSHILPAALTMEREGGSMFVTPDGKLWINKSSRDWKRRAITGKATPLEAYDDFRTIRYNPDQYPPDTKIITYSEEVGKDGITSIFWHGADRGEATLQGKLQFSFRLNDEKWSPFEEATHHTFSALSPGNYYFKVRARDADFNVDPSPAQIHFRVIPPLWQQPLFIISAILISCLIVILEIRVLQRDKKLHKINVQLSERTDVLENYSLKLEQRKNKIQKQRDRLQAMVKKIHELSQMRLRFFTNISHEFRTPLTLILGPVDRLLTNESETKAEERNKIYGIIQRNARRLLRLINQILEVYRVEQGMLTFTPTKGDIVKFIREIFSLFNSLAQQKNVSFKFSQTSDSIYTYFDFDKIEKILFNLLSNSFKNIDEHGTISMHVELISSTGEKKLPQKSNNIIQIIVKDTGRGIPADEIEHVFERFYQVKNSPTSHQHVSSGIGLSYIKDLVEIHQGTISVQSQPEKETIFTIQLPFIRQLTPEHIELSEETKKDKTLSEDIKSVLGELEETVILKSTERSKAEVTSASNRRQDKIPCFKLLIVDDDKDVREYLSNCLKDIYDIYEAANGVDGLKQANKIHPDLIISDVMMPEMDGIEFCKKLKTDFNTSHIPVILLTARTSSEHKVEGMETGADDYIEKPFDRHLLKIRIKNLIDSRNKLKERFQREITLQPAEITITSVDEIFLKNLIEIVENYMDDPTLNADIICEKIGMSRAQLYRKIKGLTGQTVNYFIKTIQLKFAARLMVEKKLTVSEAAYEVGFSAPTNFATYFRKHFGISPTEYIHDHSDHK